MKDDKKPETKAKPDKNIPKQKPSYMNVPVRNMNIKPRSRG